MIGKMNSNLYTLKDFMKSNGNVFAAEINDFYDFLRDGKEKKLFYYERPLLSPCKNRVVIYDQYTGSEKEMIMMASNNYLGLSTHPNVIKAGINAAQKYGFGSGSVPLFSGTYDIHKKLEKEIAGLFGHEDAVLFSSGYIANVGCIAALARKNDVIIHDRLNHASLLDGSAFSKASFKVFNHNSPDSLEKVLKKCSQYIRYYGRSNMFSSSLPPPDIAAALAAIEVMKTEPLHLETLNKNIAYMKTNLKKMNFNIGNTESAIIPIIIGDELKLRNMSRCLHEQGIYTNAVPYPAVPEHLSRIRLGIMSTHTKEDMDKTLEALEFGAKKVNLVRLAYNLE